MANDGSGSDIVPGDSSHGPQASAGTAVIAADAYENPGLPPHQPRVTDLDPKVDRTNERGVSLLFYASLVFSILAIAAYFAIPIVPDDPTSVRLNNLFLGL